LNNIRILYFKWFREAGNSSNMEEKNICKYLKNTHSHLFKKKDSYIIQKSTLHRVTKILGNTWTLVCRNGDLDTNHKQFVYSNTENSLPPGFERNEILETEKFVLAKEFCQELLKFDSFPYFCKGMLLNFIKLLILLFSLVIILVFYNLFFDLIQS
jgi:hypothetical protein